MTTPQQKALLIRMDRIGDLVLTLSCDQSPHLQFYDCHWVINRGLGFLPKHSQPQRKFEEVAKKVTWKEFWNFVQSIKTLKPDVAVVFHAPWWVGLALFIARVPLRIGRRSQWHSFLFFNRGQRQKRSQGSRHESDFNFDLVDLLQKPNQELPPLPDSKVKRPNLKLKPSQNQLPQIVKQFSSEKNYYVVHPGMAGSALNWPNSHYRELIQKLHTKHPVIITGTEADAPYVNPLRGYFAKTDEVLFVDKQLSIEELLSTLAGAKAVVAPSTGVVHLAASLGAPTVGIYSPIQAEQAKRWGPKGDFAVSLSPEVSIEASHPKEVMGKISVDEVLKAINEQVDKAQT